MPDDKIGSEVRGVEARLLECGTTTDGTVYLQIEHEGQTLGLFLSERDARWLADELPAVLSDVAEQVRRN